MYINYELFCNSFPACSSEYNSCTQVIVSINKYQNIEICRTENKSISGDSVLIVVVLQFRLFVSFRKRFGR